MRLNLARITVFGLLLAALGIAIVCFTGRRPPLPVDPYAAPWIGLPHGGMDASEFATRQIVSWGDWSQGGRFETLAYQCGNLERRSAVEKERYVANIGKDAWGPRWKVVMEVEQDDISIAWSHDGSAFPLPPPPPPGQATADASPEHILPVARIRKTRAEMEKIRALWNDEALWHAPQLVDAFMCTDGNAVFLEACVGGRYAGRYRNCNGSTYDATAKLWRAFNEALPPPPEPEWR